MKSSPHIDPIQIELEINHVVPSQAQAQPMLKHLGSSATQSTVWAYT